MSEPWDNRAEIPMDDRGIDAEDLFAKQLAVVKADSTGLLGILSVVVMKSNYPSEFALARVSATGRDRAIQLAAVEFLIARWKSFDSPLLLGVRAALQGISQVLQEDLKEEVEANP